MFGSGGGNSTQSSSHGPKLIEPRVPKENEQVGVEMNPLTHSNEVDTNDSLPPESPSS